MPHYLPQYQHDVLVVINSVKPQLPGFVQHHVAQALVEYMNAHPEVDLQGGSALHAQSRSFAEIEEGCET